VIGLVGLPILMALVLKHFALSMAIVAIVAAIDVFLIARAEGIQMADRRS
jgi:hypothetical protein